MASCTHYHGSEWYWLMLSELDMKQIHKKADDGPAVAVAQLVRYYAHDTDVGLDSSVACYFSDHLHPPLFIISTLKFKITVDFYHAFLSFIVYWLGVELGAMQKLDISTFFLR